MYDAIIVGARCAGSPLAMLLARQGHRVLMVDKASFPSDTMSTHGLKTPAVKRLKEWGLLDTVLATNCPPIHSQTLDLGELRLSGSPPGSGDIRFLVAPRRYLLDTILVEAATAAGAELRERFTVDEVLFEDGRATGIRGHAQGGVGVTEHARIVIGADGRNSTVAKAVGARTTIDRGPLCCGYYSYFSDAPSDQLELYPRTGRFMAVIPTNDDLTAVLVEWPREEFQAVRSDIEGNFFESLDLAPGLAERVRSGRREERFTGTVDLPNFLRSAFGPGWALAGDALSHKDPILGQGIVDAFNDAAYLAAAVHTGLSGEWPMELALAGYERQHLAASMPIFDMTCTFAELGPPAPELQRLLGALAGNQDGIDQFLGTIDGSVSHHDFFAPDNIAQLMTMAA
jgi:2-polyprenyl-6-methoxyphenol hydroxylase-like FAD-dependent oxidoreductase